MKLVLSVSLLAGLGAAQQSCPTFTSSYPCSTCTVAECIQLTTVTIPCGCPVPPATSSSSQVCGGDYTCPPPTCSTSSTYLAIPCATSVTSPTTKSSTTLSTTTTTTTSKATGCPTITNTVSPPNCTPTGLNGGPCGEPACIELVSVTVPCSCVADLPVPTTVVTAPCTCRTTCEVTSTPVFLPCATSVTSPTTTTTTTTTTTKHTTTTTTSTGHKHHTTTSEGGCY